MELWLYVVTTLSTLESKQHSISNYSKYGSVDRAYAQAYGRWSMGCGFNPIRVINGVGKGIRPQLLLCYNDKTVPGPAQEGAHSRASHQV